MLKFKRIIISTLVAAIVMMGLSGLWHGIILNDFQKITLSFPFFTILSFISYALISLALNFVLFKLEFNEDHTRKRMLIGGIAGFCVYLVVFTLGMSYGQRGIEHVVIDFGWQMVEQGMGALAIDFCLTVFSRIDKFEAVDE